MRTCDLRNCLIILSIICCLFLLYVSITSGYGNSFAPTESLRTYPYERLQSLQDNQEKLSILGEWLRAPEGTSPPKRRYLNDSSSLLILVWKYGPFLQRRHIRQFTANSSSSLWQNCSVKDCRLSYLDDDLSNADAVIFHLHLTKNVREIPRKRGKPDQIWIFMTDESPLHTFLHHQDSTDERISNYDNIFDWSMTYRSDSDVPVAYGRTLMRKKTRELISSRALAIRGKTKLVAIMGSNCSSKNSRWKYVRELERLLGEKLDIYGRCLGGNTTACPGHFHTDCPLLDAYKFYLAFENSNCREYLTEKIYWNAYEKKSVPIVMGATREDCKRLLPPRSFIHVDDFFGPNELANYLRYLDNNDAAYAGYHQWRSRYIVLNEHGYFGSVSKHYCRVCEALRYNTLPSINGDKYRHIENYWNASRDCRSDPHF